MTDRPSFTLSEAADATGKTKKTMRRRLDAGDFPNAYREAGPGNSNSWPWRVPLEDLLAAGFQLHEPTPPDVEPEPQETPAPAVDADQVAELKAENSELRRRAEVAEAVADERAKALERADLALRALTAGPTTSTAPEAESDDPPTPPEPPSGEPDDAEPEQPEKRRGRLGRWWYGG